MGFFSEIAAPLIQLGIPVVPLRPKTKAAFLPNWQDLASTSPEQIETWDKAYPEANVASVAKAQVGGVWFFEIDRLEVAERVLAETGNRLFAIPTFKVRSRPGRGHFYFKQNSRSIAMDNIAQNFVKCNDWSARVNNQYVVGPGSWHPDSGLQYHTFDESPIAEAPDWLINWLISQKVAETTEEPQVKADSSPFVYTEQEKREFRSLDASREGPKIPRGAHDNTLTRIAGKLHWLHQDWSEQELTDELVAVCEARCENYGSDYKEMCEKIAHSIGKKPVKVDAFAAAVEARAEQAKAAQEQEEPEPVLETASALPRPVFPEWVMYGTSLWEGLVKPVMETSDKYPELVFMPAVLMYLNYLGNKVVVKNRPFVPSLFLGIISPFGKFFKSSSCEVSQEYFKVMGFAADHNQKSGSAEGKTVVITPGSAEGLGVELYKTNSRNAVLFYDELAKFISKAGVESSTLGSDILSFYEARRYSNAIKARKDSFTFESRTYCFSWLWATTDRKFPGLWSQLPGDSSGLNDRMFFLLSPPEPKKAQFREQLDQFNLDGLQKTKTLISAAVAQKIFEYDFFSNADRHFDGFEAREQALLERLAVYFTVDMGETSITEAALEKAKALTLYASATRAYLEPVEADTRDGRIAKTIYRELQRSGCKMRYRDLYRKLDGLGGGRMWLDTFKSLCAQKIVIYREGRRGGKDPRPAMVYLPKDEDY